ncbi:RNA-binding protein 44 isoform X1 [Corythoichthys intestinalis]|uniref:RNA-binding protein 44 isoform X1 n=1 Tax=Corythoichthys intestinalis TaxID=161448 RepID=UPI0025A4DBE1|nr:RNA-binding protein 44 isoform X1 [Corythoichthys intestinalis]
MVHEFATLFQMADTSTLGTSFIQHSSVFTQTEELMKANKNVDTELLMSDLDYVVQEFTNLVMTQGLRSQDQKRLNHQVKPCHCVVRAQKAELSVLALEYHMFRQHCSRYQLSAESPASIPAALQKLESDYNQMRDKILAGIPLNHLKPLAIDCDVSIGDVLENQGRSSVTLSEKTKDKGGILPESSQDAGGTSRNTNTVRANVPGQSQSNTCQDLNTGELWYDAEEDFHPSSFPAKVENHPEMSKDAELAKEKKMTPGFTVPNTANNVTEANTQTVPCISKSFGVSSTSKPRATFVQEQYSAMVAFDTLMTELTRMHPDVARQNIVAALMELWEHYKSDICFLPLNIIIQMASDLLSRPANVMPPEENIFTNK